MFRRHYVIVIFALALSGQSVYDFGFRPHAAAFRRAAECLTEVAMREGSVLDVHGRRFIMEVVLNRALRIASRSGFLSDVCRATGGWHKDAKTRQPVSDFAGAAAPRQFYVEANPQRWNETYEVAEYALLDYAVLRRILPWWHTQLPPPAGADHLFYHNAYPAGRLEAWKKANRVACDFNYPPNGPNSLAFCFPEKTEAKK